jgi:VanZ family protein
VHKTSAWPLALAYTALIVYASLYPFSGWHDQGISPLAFLASPLPPKYWTGFDVAANVAGYVPLGFLLALSYVRRGGLRFIAMTKTAAVAIATLSVALLSFSMEALQTYLPSRVASNLDLILNITGALVGAVFAAWLEVAGFIDHWSRFRDRWFVDHARGALVLLALWPFALLFPAAVPLGLGQVLERLEETLGDWLMDTPFLEWLPVREVELQPLVPAAELLCVALGVLVPSLLGYSIMRSAGRRAAFAFVVVLLGAAATALSAALSWGPQHAWAWVTPPVRLGFGLGLLMSLAMLAVPRRGCAAVILVALVLQLSMLNNAPTSAYFAQTLQTWEQGRFIHFHGLAQWFGWLWPFVTLWYVLMRVSRQDPPPRIAG